MKKTMVTLHCALPINLFSLPFFCVFFLLLCVLLVMGLGPKILDISSLGFPIVCFGGVVFCLDLDLLLFFLVLFPCQVIFLYLFIYLFMYLF
jgi:hypothetical protein